MSRFGTWRAARRRASRRTDRRELWLPASRASDATLLSPDAASHLSDGVLVETRLLARVLGIRRLRVDGVVSLAPARIATRGAGGTAVPSPSEFTDTVPTSVAVGPTPKVGPTLPVGPTPKDGGRTTVPGAGLARASGLLEDCARLSGSARAPIAVSKDG